MSGGSYCYLCHKDALSIASARRDLSDMRDRLKDLGYPDAAKETDSILRVLDLQTEVLQAKIDRLNAVWRAVEWYDSADSGLEVIAVAVAAYRRDPS